MTKHEVRNLEELGNAIWSSQIGDTIYINDGEYGYIPIKKGVNYHFSENASVVEILGLGIILGDGTWSAGSIEINEIKINNPKVNKNNIKMYYLFRQKLPFNSQLPHPTTFLHPNGTLVRLLNEATQSGFSIGASNSLPCDFMEVIVPSFQYYDVALANNYDFKNFENSSKERDLKNSIERQSGHPYANFRNNFEYLAFWAVNDFIREYAKIFQLHHVEGFSFYQFSNELGKGIFYDLGQPSVEGFLSSYIARFDNSILPNNGPLLQEALLKTEDFSLNNYIKINLNKFNYQAAIIGMYQLFETGLQASTNPNNKWEYIEGRTNDPTVKKNLAEMINARNWVTHHRQLKTEDKKTKDSRNNPLKVDWGAEKLNQFQIFYRMKPWDWYMYLDRFLA